MSGIRAKGQKAIGITADVCSREDDWMKLLLFMAENPNIVFSKDTVY